MYVFSYSQIFSHETLVNTSPSPCPEAAVASKSIIDTSSANKITSDTIACHTRQAIDYSKRLPKEWQNSNMTSADQQWIGQYVFDGRNKLKDRLSLWYYPPEVVGVSITTKPHPDKYFRHRLCLWAPRRIWGMAFKCPSVCNLLNKSNVHKVNYFPADYLFCTCIEVHYLLYS